MTDRNRKGYGRSKLPREVLLRRKPSATYIHGVFGQVPSLYQVIDQKLQELGWNWSTLADRANYTRTHIVKITESDSIPYDTFCRICSALDLDPDELIEPLSDDREKETA